MSAIRKTNEVKKMGLGTMAVRGALLAVAGGMLYVSVLNPLLHRIRQDNSVIETGYVNPKSLSVQGRKNTLGNIETYLNYKSGDETVSLPCMKGPSGPLCGTVEYWWGSIGAGQREELAVDEWPALSNDAKHGIMSSELQTILNVFYGVQNGQRTPQTQQQPNYNGTKRK